MQAGQLVVLTGKRKESELNSTVRLEITTGELPCGPHQSLYLQLTQYYAYLDATQLLPAQRSRLQLQSVYVQSDTLLIAKSALFLPQSQDCSTPLLDQTYFQGLTSNFGHYNTYSPKDVKYMVFIHVLDSPRPTFSSLTYSDHNAVLIFPNERPHEKAIWINWQQLVEFSPYFGGLFGSGFLESDNILPSVKDCPQTITQDISRIAQNYRSSKVRQRSPSLANSEPEPDTAEVDEGGFFDFESDLDQIHGIRYAIIEDTPYAVYRAVITWILTGKIGFKALRSRSSSVQQSSPVVNSAGDPHFRVLSETVPCCPKKIYKLAHKLDIPALCQLALKDYEMQLD